MLLGVGFYAAYQSAISPSVLLTPYLRTDKVRPQWMPEYFTAAAAREGTFKARKSADT